MKPDRIVFVVRSDAATKPGGDLVQVREYQDALISDGFEVSIQPWRPNLRFRPQELLVLVNIDRPYELVHAWRRTTDTPTVIVPVHHRSASIRLLRASEASVSRQRRLLGMLSPAVRELLTFTRRTLQSESSLPDRAGAVLWAVLACPRLTSLTRQALESVNGLAFLSDKERHAVQEDFGARAKATVLAPNGISWGSEREEWRRRSTRVLVVGRIEPRKRQLEFLAAADEIGLAVDFVGKIDQNSGAYGEQFLSKVNGSTLSSWMGSLPHDETLSVMGRTRVVVNASWVEVQSLVELEAAAAGCYVITTDSGSAREYLGGSARVFPESAPLRDLARAALEAARSATAPPEFVYEHTWGSSAKAIVELGLDPAAYATD